MACMTDNISTNLSALFRDLPSTLAGFSPLLLFLFAASFAAADDAADTALQLRLIESEDNTIAELATEGQQDAFFNPYDRTQFDALTIQALQRQEAGDMWPHLRRSTRPGKSPGLLMASCTALRFPSFKA